VVHARYVRILFESGHIPDPGAISASATIVKTDRIAVRFGPVAQLVRAGDSSTWCAHTERYEMNGMNSGKP